MYTVAVFQLAKATGLDFLFFIPHYFLYIALCAWLVTFVEFVHNVLRALLDLRSNKRRRAEISLYRTEGLPSAGDFYEC